MGPCSPAPRALPSGLPVACWASSASLTTAGPQSPDNVACPVGPVRDHPPTFLVLVQVGGASPLPTPVLEAHNKKQKGN